MLNIEEFKRRVENAEYEICYASKILKGEVFGDIDYALTRLMEAEKQISVIKDYFYK